MYKLGKLTCGLSIFKKTYFEKCSQSKNGQNEYLHEQFNQKKRLRNIYKQTNVTSIPESTADQATVSTKILTCKNQLNGISIKKMVQKQ